VIRPRPRGRQTSARVGAFLLTVGLLLGAAAGLRATSLPAFASGREIIRELDALILERFAFAQPEDAPMEEDLPESVDEDSEDVSFDDQVGAAVAGLEDLFGSRSASAPTAVTRDAVSDADETPGIQVAADDARFESLFGDRGDAPTGRVGRSRSARSTGSGIGLGINERLAEARQGADTPGSSSGGPDVTVRTGTERADVEVPTVVITEYEADGFDGSEADRLGAWMRAHPSPLPVGVRVHMNYQPAFLTSAVPFESGGVRWELYLMFNEALRELHIVLVEGDRSVYLIDRGFQERSRSLREGTVRRADGRIVAVDSRSGAASGDRAREFYNVFLSWWGTVEGDSGA